MCILHLHVSSAAAPCVFNKRAHCSQTALNSLCVCFSSSPGPCQQLVTSPGHESSTGKNVLHVSIPLTLQYRAGLESTVCSQQSKLSYFTSPIYKVKALKAHWPIKGAGSSSVCCLVCAFPAETCLVSLCETVFCAKLNVKLPPSFFFFFFTINAVMFLTKVSYRSSSIGQRFQ